jgi:hypothetical protein
VSGRVVGQPSEDGRYAAVEACCHEEGHAVLDVRAGNVGDNSVADDSNGQSTAYMSVRVRRCRRRDRGPTNQSMMTPRTLKRSDMTATMTVTTAATA